MSHNQTEDLSSVEPLTAEQEELIIGAGLPSFRPRVEGLEERQMLDAGLGQALRPAALVGPALVGSAAPGAEALPTSFAPRGQAVSADARLVEASVRAFLKDSIIGNGLSSGKLSNPWRLSYSLLDLGPSNFSETGNKIEVSYHLQYGSPTRYCYVWMVIESQMKGGDKVYTLKAAGLHQWESGLDSFFASPDGFEAYARGKFQNKFADGIHINKFDQNRFVQNVVRQTERIEGASTGSFRAQEVTPIDGGLRVIINRGVVSGREQFTKLEFKYSDADVSAGWVKLASVQNGERVKITNHYRVIYSGEYPADHRLKAARWWLADSAPQGQAATHDDSAIESQVRAFLKDKIIGNGPFNGRLSNRWMLSNYEAICVNYTDSSNKIEISFRVHYGVNWDSVRSCNVWMVFDSKAQGGERVLTLKAAGLYQYEGSFGDEFEGVAKDLFQQTYPGGLRIH
jgi:hypothetical protein